MKNTVGALLFLLTATAGCTQNNQTQTGMNYKKLTPEEEKVIINRGTEKPFSGEYYMFTKEGTYACKHCGIMLYKSNDKFDSGCGWPSFDDEIPEAVKRVPDADGVRTEIVCANCGAHLGHVFNGEGFTPKNTRHCVNSISLEFVPNDKLLEIKTDTAIFAGGCFWGMEYFFQKAKGVLSTESGYIGGHTNNPSYKEVCSHTTGHAEAIRVVFDPSKTTYEELARLFFEIHDPTQENKQGPDVGDQYRSEIFYMNNDQKEVAERLISVLKQKGYRVVTKIAGASTFWKAEDYHQQYYEHKGTTPYCHGYVQRF